MPEAIVIQAIDVDTISTWPNGQDIEEYQALPD